MVFRSVLSLKGRLNRRHLPPPFKDGENARALVNTFVGMAPGTKSLPGGAVPDLVADTDTLMSKATREKIDNAQENTQTAGYNWGNGIRESLAIALHNDGKRRDPRISLVDGEKDEKLQLNVNFRSDGRLRAGLSSTELEALRRWGEKQSLQGDDGATVKTWAVNAFTNTKGAPGPPPEVGPPPLASAP